MRQQGGLYRHTKDERRGGASTSNQTQFGMIKLYSIWVAGNYRLMLPGFFKLLISKNLVLEVCLKINVFVKIEIFNCVFP